MKDVIATAVLVLGVAAYFLHLPTSAHLGWLAMVFAAFASGYLTRGALPRCAGAADHVRSRP